MKRILVGLLLAAAAGLALAVGTVNQLRIFPDQSGTYSSQVRLAPTYTDARVLAATVAESHTIPATTRYVLFAANCTEFYAVLNGTAATPSGDVTDGTSSEMNPTAWFVEGGATIGVISPTTCIVTMSFYK